MAVGIMVPTLVTFGGWDMDQGLEVWYSLQDGFSKKGGWFSCWRVGGHTKMGKMDALYHLVKKLSEKDHHVIWIDWSYRSEGRRWKSLGMTVRKKIYTTTYKKDKGIGVGISVGIR